MPAVTAAVQGSTRSEIFVCAREEEMAVEQWHYETATVDGRPQELNTIINVIYSLSY